MNFFQKLFKKSSKRPAKENIKDISTISFEMCNVVEHNKKEGYYVVCSEPEALYSIETKYNYKSLNDIYNEEPCISSSVDGKLYDERYGYGNLKIDEQCGFVDIDIKYHNKNGPAINLYYLKSDKETHHFYYLHGKTVKKPLLEWYWHNQLDGNLTDDELPANFLLMKNITFMEGY